MDRREIAALVRLMKREGVGEFTVESGDSRLQVRFAGAAPAFTAAPVAVLTPASAPVSASGPAPARADAKGIKAPIVGTFYRAASPDAPSYINVGDTVRKGQVVCIVEAMKLMNQIESDVDGVVVEVLVENGQPVQFGQELFRLASR